MFILKKIGKGRKKEKETTVHYGSLIKMLNTNSLKKSEEGSEAKAADRAVFHSASLPCSGSHQVSTG